MISFSLQHLTLRMEKTLGSLGHFTSKETEAYAGKASQATQQVSVRGGTENRPLRSQAASSAGGSKEGSVDSLGKPRGMITTLH